MSGTEFAAALSGRTMLSEGTRGRAGTKGRSWRHDRLLTSEFGTNLPNGNVRSWAAIGAKPDMTRIAQSGREDNLGHQLCQVSHDILHEGAGPGSAWPCLF